MKAKKVPLRTCIGCREVKPKKELIRIVRKLAGEIAVDPTGKASGRGAYICPEDECLDTAFKKKRFSYALEVSVTEADLERLKRQLKDLIESASINKNRAVK